LPTFSAIRRRPGGRPAFPILVAAQRIGKPLVRLAIRRFLQRFQKGEFGHEA